MKIKDKKIMSLYRNKNELETLISMGVNYPVASVDTAQIMQKFKDLSKDYGQIKNNLEIFK